MKKRLLAFLTLCLLVPFAACSASETHQTSDVPSAESAQNPALQEDSDTESTDSVSEQAQPETSSEEGSGQPDAESSPDENMQTGTNLSAENETPSGPDAQAEDESQTDTNAQPDENTPSQSDDPSEQLPTTEQLRLTVNGKVLDVEWENNETVAQILDYAKQGEIRVDATRYGGFEQVGSLPQSFVRNDVLTTTQPGDIMLYSGNQIVLFYESNTFRYTKLGHINGLSDEELTDLLQQDSVQIILFR